MLGAAISAPILRITHILFRILLMPRKNKPQNPLARYTLFEKQIFRRRNMFRETNRRTTNNLLHTIRLFVIRSDDFFIDEYFF